MEILNLVLWALGIISLVIGLASLEFRWSHSITMLCWSIPAGQSAGVAFRVLWGF